MNVISFDIPRAHINISSLSTSFIHLVAGKVVPELQEDLSGDQSWQGQPLPEEVSEPNRSQESAGMRAQQWDQLVSVRGIHQQETSHRISSGRLRSAINVSLSTIQSHILSDALSLQGLLYLLKTHLCKRIHLKASHEGSRCCECF